MTTPDITPDFRALCKELGALMISLASTHPNLSENGVRIVNELSDRADAALATPPPEPPTDEELLRKYGVAKRDFCYEGPTDDWPKRAERAATIYGLRAVLERWGRPTVEPAPVMDAAEIVALIQAHSDVEPVMGTSRVLKESAFETVASALLERWGNGK